MPLINAAHDPVLDVDPDHPVLEVYAVYLLLEAYRELGPPARRPVWWSRTEGWPYRYGTN